MIQRSSWPSGRYCDSTKPAPLATNQHPGKT
jgi:hypothetical protein